MDKIAPEVLHRRWIHSHEEDTAEEMVFRPEAFPFPRSRGRAAFELKPDQTLVETGIAPADGPLISRGTWTLDTTGRLFFYGDAPSKASRVMQITAASKERLVVRK